MSTYVVGPNGKAYERRAVKACSCGERGYIAIGSVVTAMCLNTGCAVIAYRDGGKGQ